MRKDRFEDYPIIVTIEDVQHMLHIGRNAAYALVRSGKIKTLKNGTRYIIPRSSVENFIANNVG